MTVADRVYAIVKKIPKGKVATYGQIARLSGGLNPRYIGNLLHDNPDPSTIPCHRIVNSLGKLASGFAFGGAREHKRRLEEEGVDVVDWRVNLSAYQWIP
jgi:O-6-methylguanine DNA methyltransferase